MHQVITASRLSDGAVMFLAPDGVWTTAFAQARVLGDKAEVAKALGDAERAMQADGVLDIFASEVVVSDGVATPATLRDRIRARGPTISYDGSRPSIGAAALGDPDVSL